MGVASWDRKWVGLGVVVVEKQVVLVAGIDFAVWEEIVEWALTEAACWWVEQEAELHTDLAHHQVVRMELDYQIVAGMGMGLWVEADSDIAVQVH